MKFENKEAFEKANMFGTGTPNTAYAKYFIGDSFLNPLTDAECDLFAARPARAGIRKKAKRRSACMRAAS